MRGDFTRNTFHRQHHYARVLMQQGRVLLDADWNEQTSILLHYLRTLAVDLIGPRGGPGNSFKVLCDDDLECDFVIDWGHYYVDGILCENEPPPKCPPADEVAQVTYTTQPDYPILEEDEALLEVNTDYLVYLDVWERHLTYLQAGDIREVALGGPDTATRAKIVWQLKVAEEPEDTPDDATCADILGAVIQNPPRCLRARARVDTSSDDPCIIPPQARYRGAENQLYRVEIHDGGTTSGSKCCAGFKWSRDNGSIVFAIREVQGSIVTLDSLGPDERRSLKEGDWVEIVDDFSELRFKPYPLVKVEAVDRVSYQVTLAVPSGVTLPAFDEHSTTHPLLRRWDQHAKLITVQEGKWIDLEDGVQVHFEPGGTYQRGDYWLIPARTAIGDVLWPTEQGPDGAPQPQAVAPHGIRHHYAPLGRISVDASGAVNCAGDCRCTFDPLCAAAAVSPPHPEPGDVVFPPNGNDLGEAQTGVLVGNVAILNQRFAADATIRADIAGFAAPGEDAPAALSAARAEAVRKFYADNRIDPTRLAARGAGVDEDPGKPDAEKRRAETNLAGRAAPSPARGEDRLAELRDIDGVGERRAEILLASGRGNARAVAAMTVEQISALLGVSAATAREIHTSAGEIAEGKT